MSNAIQDRARTVTTDKSQGTKLAFVPILGRSFEQPAYELLRAETLGSVQVTEVSAGGSVPELLVQNDLDVRVFLMDGQELVGAKQNRILNTDVLIPAHSTVKIPVSCVEQGRWRQESAAFSSGKSASHRTRSAKLARVHQNLKSHGRHDADQGAVWNEVAESLQQCGVDSPTSALADAYATRDADLRGLRAELRLPEDAIGVAVFHGGKLQGLDLFDRASTLRYFWESLVDSYAIDLLAAPIDPAQPASDEARVIRSALDRCIESRWERFNPPGEGAEWRLETPDLAAAALVWNEQTTLHLQLFPKTPASAGPSAGYRPRVRRRYGS